MRASLPVPSATFCFSLLLLCGLSVVGVCVQGLFPRSWGGPWWVCVQGNWAGWLTAQGSSVCVTPSCSCRVPGWPGEHFLFLTPLTVAGGRGGSGGWGTAGQTPHEPKGAASVHHQNLKLLSSSPRKQVNYWGPPRDSWPAPQIAVGYSFFSLELLPMDHTVIKGFH